MKKNIFLLILAVLLISVVVAGCAGRDTGSPPTQGDTNGAVDAGELVESRCARCHNLSQVHQIRDKDSWPGIVSTMIGKSPGLLSENEKEAVIEYLQENYGR